MPGPDDASERTSPWLVRSEERARVAFPVRVRGRVRLSKRVVTEEVTRTFVLRREELVVEEVPDDGTAELSWTSQVGDAVAEPFEIVLRAEQVQTSTVVVPVERIRVVTRVVTTDVDVSADLLREQIEVDGHTRAAATAADSAVAGDAQDDQTGAGHLGARPNEEELT